MKKGIAELLTKWLNYQQVKEKHERPSGLAHNIELREWKWEITHMDFITGLPKFRRQHYSIWVIMDRMTQSTHIFLVKTTHLLKDFARYISKRR